MTRCRSCNAPVIFFEHVTSGRAAPFRLDDQGTWIIDVDGKARHVGPPSAQLEIGATPAQRYTPHFASCPDAAKWRAAVAKARGKRSRHQTRRSVSLSGELHQRLLDFASAHRISAAQVVTQAVEALLRKDLALEPAVAPTALRKATMAKRSRLDQIRDAKPWSPS